MKELLSGNEAIARGAFEGGAGFAAAYPGTPSTEILESFARYPGVTAQWSPNEKVALEVGIGGSLAGVRTLVAMKHVGVNVAADPLFTFSYTGVNAGLVLVSADDPGMHSSQNEQDNRHYARAAKLPMLEPSDSTEARDMTVLAFDLSEEFDTPVMLRSTTRISHSKGLLHLKERRDAGIKEYKKDPKKYVMIPAFGRSAPPGSPETSGKTAGLCGDHPLEPHRERL
jgi:indolepyruvate ferredoxin oxidoreductase, alpha subunit